MVPILLLASFQCARNFLNLPFFQVSFTSCRSTVFLMWFETVAMWRMSQWLVLDCLSLKKIRAHSRKPVTSGCWGASSNSSAIRCCTPSCKTNLPTSTVYSFHDEIKEGVRSWRQRETLLHCFRLRHRAQIDYGKFRQEADPHALKRKHLRCQRRTFLLGECFSRRLHWHLSQRSPRHFFSHSGSVTLTSARICTFMSCCQVSRPCSKRLLSAWQRIRQSCRSMKVKSGCSTRESVLGADWRVHLALFFFCTFHQMWISRASTMDLARPSSKKRCFWTHHVDFPHFGARVYF